MSLEYLKKYFEIARFSESLICGNKSVLTKQILFYKNMNNFFIWIEPVSVTDMKQNIPILISTSSPMKVPQSDSC